MLLTHELSVEELELLKEAGTGLVACWVFECSQCWLKLWNSLAAGSGIEIGPDAAARRGLGVQDVARAFADAWFGDRSWGNSSSFVAIFCHLLTADCGRGWKGGSRRWSEGGDFVEAGGLMACVNLSSSGRLAAYVDRIIKGPKPTTCPWQPTKFDFVINIQTARALGLTTAVAARTSGSGD